jgi:two-component system chemotaxis response regulator CheB
MVVEEGLILVAPGGGHLEFAADGNAVVAQIAPRLSSERYTPSIDRMFRSASKHFGRELLALVLTGMGDDGAAGSLEVKRAGGNVIAESAETAVIFGMPQQAIRAGGVDAVLPLHQIAGAIESGLGTRGARARSAK